MTTKNFVVKNGLTTGNIILDASSSNITANVVVANLSVPASANLGSNANVKITGGTSGQYLQTDGSGTLSWATIAPSSSYGNSNVAAYLPTYSGVIGGTLSSNAQPNVTSVGTLSSLVIGNSASNVTITDVNGNGFMTATGNITAPYFIGNVIGNISGTLTVPGNNTAVLFNDAGAAGASDGFKFNKTSNSLTLNGNVTTVNANLGNLVTANYFSGSGNLLSNIVGGNVTGTVASATIAGTVTTNAQPNITSLGTLSGLTVTGETIFNGNLTVNGTFEYANVATFRVQDPIIEQGGKTDGTALTLNDGYDRGQLLHYYSGSAKDAFMGWDNSNAEFAFGSNVSVTSEVVTFNEFGNVRASYFIGNGSQLTGLPATYANSNVASYLPTYTGLVAAGNVTATGNVTAAYFVGAGNLLSNIVGGNVTGQVANALIATTAGTVTTNAQPNITSVGTLTSLVIGNNVSNVTITDVNGNGFMTATGNITAPYFIGNVIGNISGTLTVPGNNTAVLFNDAGAAGASDGFKFNKTSNAITLNGNVTANYFIGDGSQLTGLPATYANSNVDSYLPTYTGLVAAGNVSATGNVTATYFIGNGSQLTGLPATYANSNVAAYLPTYTGLVAAGNVSATGNVTAAYLIGNGSQLSGMYSNTNVASYLPTYTGLVSAGNVTTTGNVTASYLVGNGSLLTSITGANVTGTVANATYATSAGSATTATSATTAGTVTTNAQPNITSVGTLTSLTSGLITATSGGIKLGNIQDPSGTNTISLASGQVTMVGNLQVGTGGTGNVTASYLIGNGSQLTGTIANANYAAYAGNLTIGSQPNITSVGTLTDLTISGNLTVGGATEYTNVTNLYVKDPIIEQGGLANAGALTSNDGKDRGQLLHYYSGGVVDAFMGWDNSNAEFAFGSNVSVASELVTFNNFGNIRANYFLGNASQLVGTIANANYAAFAGVVTATSQPNISSVGTLTSVTVSGLVTAGNVTSTGNVTASYLIGNGSALTSITGGNVTGTVSSATTAATVTTAAQPNITSVGTLVSTTLIANANISLSGSLSEISGANLVSANFVSGNGSLLTSITGANVTGTVASATVAGTVSANAQPNITSTGILSNLTSAGTVNFTTASNVSLGSNANVKLTGGTTGQYLQTDGTGNLAWATVSGGGGGSNIANGTSNVNIATANGNVQIVSNGNIVANVTGTGANITGTLNVSGVVTATASGIRVGNLIDPSGTSTVSIASGNVGILGGLSVGTSGAGNLTVSGKTDLGAVGNVKITGGTTGQVLTTNGSGVLSWATAAGGGGSSLTYTAAATPPGSANVADQWFNTTTNVLYEYMNDGSASYWVDIATPTTSSLVTSSYVNHNYTGDGTTTGYTVTLGCGVNDVLVFLNGVCQSPTLDYTISGTVLTLDAAPISGTRIQIRELPR